MRNFDPENSREADELLAILKNPMAHVDIRFEIEKMVLFAYDRNFKRTQCPYFKNTELEDKFRRSWNELTEHVEDGNSFHPAKVWLDAYDDQMEEVHLAACANEKLKW